MEVHDEGIRDWLSDGGCYLLHGWRLFFLSPNMAEEENNLPLTSSMNMLISFSGLSLPDLMTSGRSQFQSYRTVDQILIYEFQKDRNLETVAKMFCVQLVVSDHSGSWLKLPLSISHSLPISLCPYRHRHIHLCVHYRLAQGMHAKIHIYWKSAFSESKCVPVHSLYLCIIL